MPSFRAQRSKIPTLSEEISWILTRKSMTHEKFEGERTLMRIHIGESDKWHGKPLHEAIVEMLRKDGFSGATVLRGVGGYGGSSIYHTDKLLRLRLLRHLDWNFRLNHDPASSEPNF